MKIDLDELERKARRERPSITEMVKECRMISDGTLAAGDMIQDLMEFVDKGAVMT